MQIVPVTVPELWKRLEFRITNVPTVPNPFDPDTIRVEGTFLLPSGRTVSVPAFWFQNYQRSLSGGKEVVSPVGTPEWSLRFAPTETGLCSVTVSVFTNGHPYGVAASNSFTVSGMPLVRGGYVRVDAASQYLETGDGQALRLVGANVCWHGARGTYDYDDWFAALQAAGGNYARLWMWPSSFGLETDPASLNQYRLDRAWQLDYVFHLAEQRGIYLELCLDYHGMFAVEPDYWGGNNYWPRNPYSVTNGGPCVNQNAFFTNSTAKSVYQKRLRYLVARYGYSPNLLAWQFFNEIDNVYQFLNPASVAAWHAEMGGWLRANDPFAHLVTTSFTSVEPHPEIWSLPEIDLVCAHSYGAVRPAAAFATLTESLRKKYGKPVLVDEYGTSWQGWNRAADPYLRGFRQGLWGGALGGSVGTAMSWWWQNIHTENAYPAFQGLSTILNRTGWGRGPWTNLVFSTSLTPPDTVGDPVSNGVPFTLTLPLSGSWAAMLPGRLAVPNGGAANYSATLLNSFVHGSSHADLRIPFRLSAWLTNDARLVMHLNSVSWNPVLMVRADGVELFRTNLPNLDGGWTVSDEYNLDLAVNLPPGKRLIEIINAGSDWFYLDWVRLEQVLPASYANNWQPSCEPIGLAGPREALLYVVAPGVAFPGSATNASLPLQQNQTVTISNWPPGDFLAEWYDPLSGNLVGTSQSRAATNSLTLPLPPFDTDLAGVLYGRCKLTPLGFEPGDIFSFQLQSETGGRYWIETSTNLSQWTPYRLLTNASGIITLTVTNTGAPMHYYRAKKQ